MDCDIKPITNNIHENLRPVAPMFPQSGDFHRRSDGGRFLSGRFEFVSSQTMNAPMMDNPLTPHPGV